MDEDSLVYKGLAATLAIIIATKLKDFVNELGTKQQTKAQLVDSMKESQQKFKCPVCLDYLEDATFASIKCGHVYCWYCISRWMGSEQNCPVCRVPCEAPDLIPLANLK